MKLLHYGELIPLQRKNCFLAAAVCSSVTKRGGFTAAASEVGRVQGGSKDLGIRALRHLVGQLRVICDFCSGILKGWR